jgi:hypothetical protein
MSHQGSPDERASKVTSEALHVLAISLGWQQQKLPRPEIVAFNGPDPARFQVVLPARNIHLADHAATVWDAVCHFAEFLGQPPSAVLDDLLLPANTCVLRFAATGGDGGEMPGPFGEALRFLGGVRLLLASLLAPAQPQLLGEPVTEAPEFARDAFDRIDACELSWNDGWRLAGRWEPATDNSNGQVNGVPGARGGVSFLDAVVALRGALERLERGISAERRSAEQLHELFKSLAPAPLPFTQQLLRLRPADELVVSATVSRPEPANVPLPPGFPKVLPSRWWEVRLPQRVFDAAATWVTWVEGARQALPA